jgi:site-specific recombinase XerD
MTFHITCRTDLPASHSPFRVVDEKERELEWINRFLDVQSTRGLATLSLRQYAITLIHFLRWWSCQPGIDVHHFTATQFTESTLIDYVRSQIDDQDHKVAPETINNRASMLRRLFRFYFNDEMPHGPYRLQRVWFRRSPLGYGRGRTAVAADLKLKVPHRVIVPLSREQVARFWASFQNARDLAIVALMLLNGLRSREVLALERDDLLFSEGLIRVRGKGSRVRLLPLPPETVRLLRCYLTTERPATTVPQVFVSRKGPARGSAMTPAGLRSLFRHHRGTSGVAAANPHRFRHTFGSDMIRAGVSLPALMRLMGHAYIHTTLLYVQLTPQDVFDEYARAVAKLAQPEVFSRP